MKYDWDKNKNDINLQKHGIAFEDVIDIFLDPYLIDWYDEAHSGYNSYGIWEDRYVAIGYVLDILYVVYTIREQDNDEVVRIISARPAEGAEIQAYMENRGVL